MTRERSKTPERVTELLKKAVEDSSQNAVARETGITQSAVHRYMKGIGEPSQATLEKLAAYFGVSVPWLRGYDLPRWIPCAEQLPDSDTTVMTFAPDSNEPVWPAYHDGDQWVDMMGGPITDAAITHWMEFPEPPDTEGKP